MESGSVPHTSAEKAFVYVHIAELYLEVNLLYVTFFLIRFLRRKTRCLLSNI
jgi:hypothetical protein